MIAPPPGPELRDIHLPPPPGWWPPAIGWWLLAAIIVTLAVTAFVAWRRHVRRRRVVDAVLAELDAAEALYARDGNRQALAATVSQLLRRVARLHDTAAVRLRGSQWQALMRSLAPKVDTHPLAMLDEAIYRRDAASDVQPMLASARLWLRTVLSRKRRPASPPRPEVADAAA
jgi:membrane protein implicated in regulation of membrane protease activity